MSDAGPPVQDPAEPSIEPQPKARKKKRSMFDDPVVRAMALGAMGIVIVFLLGVVGVLLSGIAAPTGPRTLSEVELTNARVSVRSGNADSSAWGNYVAVLISDGRLSEAQNALNDAKGSTTDSRTADFAVAEARLDNARKEYARAIAVADKGQKQIETARQAALDAGGSAARAAKLDGIHANWYVLALLKSEAYRAQGEWGKAIKEMDSYIAGNPGSADIMVDRGNAKLKLNDAAGAEADFRAALKFVPDDKEALAGLAKIGATNK